MTNPSYPPFTPRSRPLARTPRPEAADVDFLVAVREKYRRRAARAAWRAQAIQVLVVAFFALAVLSAIVRVFLAPVDPPPADLDYSVPDAARHTGGRP